jgi:hypothetical protein
MITSSHFFSLVSWLGHCTFGINLLFLTSARLILPDAAIASFSPPALDQLLVWLPRRDTEATVDVEGRRMVLHRSFLRSLRSRSDL